MAAAGRFVKGVKSSMVYEEESGDDERSIDHSQSKRKRKSSSSSRSRSKSSSSRRRSQRSRSRSRSPSSSRSRSRSPASPHNSLLPLQESQRQNIMAPDTRSAKQKAEERIEEMIAAGVARALEKSGARSPNSGEDEHYDAVMANDIYVCVKTKLWRSVKFVANGKEEEQVAVECFNAMNPNNWTEKEWVKEYRGLVTKSVNKCRSYVIGELKKEAFSYMEKNNGDLPTLEQMLKVAERSCGNVLADNLVFEWYWDEYLPKCTGNIWDWSKDKRHFETIRASKDPVTGKLHMSVTNEAFALIVFENNRGNWKEIYAKQKESGKLVVVKAKVLTAEEAKNDHPKFYFTIDAKYKPQWSSASKGQQKFGGWSGVGLNKFVQYRTIVQEARKTARAGTLEKKVLKAVRKTHKIPEELTLEEHLASKKRKRTRKERNEEDIVETIELDEE